MKQRDNWIRALLLALALCLLIGAFLGAHGRVAPENPIQAAAAVLQPESGQGAGAQAQDAAGEQQTPQEDEPEPETPPEEEPEQTPETPEQTPDEPTNVPETPSEDVPDTAEPENPSDAQDPDKPDPSQPGTGEDPSAPTDPDQPGEDPDKPGGGDPVQPEEPDGPSIDTDLTDARVTQAALPDGKLSFHAFIQNATGDETLRVTLQNSTTGLNGKTLSGDAGSFTAQLALGEYNTITLILRAPGQLLQVRSFRIYYEPTRADADTPQIGENPPSIVTNMDGRYENGDTITSDRFLLTVTARTNPAGRPIYANCITVRLNGKVISKTAGDSSPEYELHFERPNIGDTREYKIEVVAWDGLNSAYWSRTIRYRAVDEGEVKGSVNIVLDATTVGLGVLDEASYEIRQGDTWADVLLQFFEEYGYEPDHAGTSKANFYLRRLYRGDLGSGSIDPHLQELIVRDGITLNLDSHSYDSLGEFDYTMGSGWMYSIGGTLYPGQGMSSTYPNDGDTCYVRFTLCYGKDIGGYDATGGGHGQLRGYCGLWRGGSYTQLEHQYAELERVEPTATEDGHVTYQCEVCHEQTTQILPATGAPEPDPGPDPEPDPDPDPDPDPTPDPDPSNPDPEGPDPANPDPEAPDTGGSE